MKAEITDSIIFYFLCLAICLNLLLPGEIYFTTRYIGNLLIFLLFFIKVSHLLQYGGDRLSLYLPKRRLVGAFFLVGVVSTVGNTNYHLSRGFVWLFITYFLLYFLLQNLRLGDREVALFIRVLLFLTIGIVLYGFYQYFFNFELIQKVVEKLDYLSPEQKERVLRRIFSGRIFSTFALPTTLAGYVVIVIPLNLAYLAINLRKARVFILYLVPLIFSLVALMLTASFGGLVSLVGGMVLTFLVVFYERGSFRRFLLGLLIVMIILGVGLWAIGQFRGFHLWDLSAGENPIRLRLLNWQVGYNMGKDHWLKGVGLGNYGTLFPLYKIPGSQETQFAHNSLVQLFSEVGLPGVLLLLLAVVPVLWRVVIGVRRRYFQESHWEKRWLPLGLLTSIFVFVLHNMIEINLYFPSLGLLGVFLLALGARSGVWGRDYRRSSWSLSERVKKLVLLLLVGVFIFYGGWITRAYIGQIYIGEAQRLAKEGSQEAALKRASVAIRSDPTNSAYYYFKGGLIMSVTPLLPQIDEAIAAYCKAIELNPFTPHLHYELSKLYLMREMPLKGFLEAKEAERLYPLSSKYRQFARQMEENLKGREDERGRP